MDCIFKIQNDLLLEYFKILPLQLWTLSILILEQAEPFSCDDSLLSI